MEEALNDRISFRKFVGLKWEEESPDSTTFSFFRERITPIMEKLVRILKKQLKEAGFKIEEVIAIDATLVEAHSKPRGEDFEGDPEASWRGFPAKEITDENGNKSVARRSALYGYKVNLSSSVGEGFISDVSVCKASEHEVHHFEELINRKEVKAVYADKGYVGKKKKLRALGIRDHIQDKGFKNRPLTAAQIERNKKISSVRIVSESIFGGWKQWYGWKKTKYMGLIRNTLAAVLTALSWNIKKWASLMTGKDRTFSSA
jgi:IS5 family transposase